MAEPQQQQNKTEKENDALKGLKVEVSVGAKTWGHRAELVGIGAVATATGLSVVKLGERFLVKKAADEGLRHAASFAGDVFKSLFG